MQRGEGGGVSTCTDIMIKVTVNSQESEIHTMTELCVTVYKVPKLNASENGTWNRY